MSMEYGLILRAFEITEVVIKGGRCMSSLPPIFEFYWAPETNITVRFFTELFRLIRTLDV